MLKRKYIKKLYIETLVCDKCGSELEEISSDSSISYQYRCLNPNCNTTITLWNKMSNKINYEFEED